MTILLLGGTAEGRALASALDAAGRDVVTSLAGATASRVAVAGSVRVGGFGGVAGLIEWLREHGPAAVVDATHPFAAAMTAHAAEACTTVGVPLLRLSRPGWSGRPDASGWRWVGTHMEAAEAVASWASGSSAGSAGEGGAILLTVGRQSLAPYRGLTGRRVVARVAEAPEDAPAGWTIVAGRGPFRAENERALFRRFGVRVLVTKDSGGPGAKLDVARELGVPVVMVRRPEVPAGVAVVPDVAGAVEWLRSV